MDYSKLIQFATVRQLEFIEGIEKHGSQNKAARAMGVNIRTLKRSMETLKTKAAVKGWSPEHNLTHPVSPGQMLRGVSTYYDPDGNIKGQWILSTKTRNCPFCSPRSSPKCGAGRQSATATRAIGTT